MNIMEENDTKINKKYITLNFVGPKYCRAISVAAVIWHCVAYKNVACYFIPRERFLSFIIFFEFLSCVITVSDSWFLFVRELYFVNVNLSIAAIFLVKMYWTRFCIKENQLWFDIRWPKVDRLYDKRYLQGERSFSLCTAVDFHAWIRKRRQTQGSMTYELHGCFRVNTCCLTRIINAFKIV